MRRKIVTITIIKNDTQIVVYLFKCAITVCYMKNILQIVFDIGD